MDQKSLVVDEIDAGEDLIRRLDRFKPVKAALWVNEVEFGGWYLYIAFDLEDERTRDALYGEVLRLSDEISSPFLDPFRVKVIPSNHPIALAAREIHRRFPGRPIVRSGARSFGGMTVDGVYIYPDATVRHAS